MDANRVDLLIKYAMAAAGQGDFGERELGEIHLLKYVYLADVAHAEAHAGQTFTGADWTFYKFGPWCGAVRSRIQPVVDELGAVERRFSSPRFDGEGIRWRLAHGADAIVTEVEKELPWEVHRAVKLAVRKFGDDTSELLHYVYSTPPMITAAPDERLVFRAAEPRAPYAATPTPDLSDRQKKKRRHAHEKLREELRGRLAQRPRLVKPDPSPRYDAVFEAGVRALDHEVGQELESEQGELGFSDAVWKARGRHESGPP